MNLTIAAVGRIKKGPERSLWDIYAKRLRWPLSLIEVEAKNVIGIEQIKKKRLICCWLRYLKPLL